MKEANNVESREFHMRTETRKDTIEAGSEQDQASINRRNVVPIATS